jgi:hypothetical protein
VIYITLTECKRSHLLPVGELPEFSQVFHVSPTKRLGPVAAGYCVPALKGLSEISPLARSRPVGYFLLGHCQDRNQAVRVAYVQQHSF